MPRARRSPPTTTAAKAPTAASRCRSGPARPIASSRTATARIAQRGCTASRWCTATDGGRRPLKRRRSYGDEADRALDLWVALARCAASVSRVSARDIQRYGLTQAQFAVLEVLYHKGPLAL